MQFLKKLMAQDSGLPVIMITGHGDVPMAVDAMRIGAFDFLEKPFNPDKMTELAKKASQQRRMTLDNRALRRELSDGKALMKKLIGLQPEMERLREDILDLGQADSHVLIDGETGTGKTLVAHALHAVGRGQGKKFVTLVLLGLCRTDAPRSFRPRSGHAQLAPGGGGARRHAGARGYRGAAERDAGAAADLHQRAGTPPETRIIAICNAQRRRRWRTVLRPTCSSGCRRCDHLPAAAAARRGYPDAVHPHVRDQFAEEYGCDAPQVSAQEAAQLLQAPWPGNVRQLINIAERAVLQNRRGSGSITSLLMADNEATGHVIDRGQAAQGIRGGVRADADRQHDAAAQGLHRRVMDELCLPRRTLNEKMAKYGLSRGDYLSVHPEPPPSRGTLGRWPGFPGRSETDTMLGPRAVEATGDGTRSRARAATRLPSGIVLHTYRNRPTRSAPSACGPDPRCGLRARTSWQRRCLSMPRTPRRPGLSWLTEPRSRSSTSSR
jgi:CheY-like chemotaxis protein